MKYRDLRDFVGQLEQLGQLRRWSEPVSPRFELTAIGDKLLRADGPALLCTAPTGYNMPCLINLFGTPERVALGMGAGSAADLRDVGRLLAGLKEPEPPKAWKDAGKLLGMVKALWDMKRRSQRSAPCQESLLEGDAIDLGRCRCRPAARLRGPLITWGLGRHARPAGHNRAASAAEPGHLPPPVSAGVQVIMRWLAPPRWRARLRDFTRGESGQPSRSQWRWAPTRRRFWAP